MKLCYKIQTLNVNVFKLMSIPFFILLLKISLAGRSEARLIFLTRKPSMSSSHFIDQYFTSFESDPLILKTKNMIVENETSEVLR